MKKIDLWNNDKIKLNEDFQFYKDNGIDISTYKSETEHYFRIKFPNNEELKYPILIDHYIIEKYQLWQSKIYNDVKLKLRKIKLEQIKNKIK